MNKFFALINIFDIFLHSEFKEFFLIFNEQFDTFLNYIHIFLFKDSYVSCFSVKVLMKSVTPSGPQL
jgi:hypothetical protein